MPHSCGKSSRQGARIFRSQEGDLENITEPERENDPKESGEASTETPNPRTSSREIQRPDYYGVQKTSDTV